LQVHFSQFVVFEVIATHLPTESKITHTKIEVITSHGCNSTGSQQASFKVEVLAHGLYTQTLQAKLSAAGK